MNNDTSFKGNNNILKFSIAQALLYSFVAVGVWQIMGGIISAPTLFYPVLNHVLLPLSFLVGTISAIVILLMITQTKISPIVKDIKHPFSIVQLILAISCWVLFLPLLEFFTSLVPTDGLLKPLYDMFESSFKLMLNYKIAGFLMVCILAPIFEEIIFRGIILKGMLNFNVNPTTAILLNGFIFGCAHMNPWQFIGAGFLGVIFGFIYYRTKSLFLPMLLHFLNNTLSYAIMLTQENVEGEVFPTNFILLGTMTILGIFSILLLYKNTAQKQL